MFNILYLNKKIFFLPLLFLSVISFEITLYPYYSFVSMISFLGILFFIFYYYKAIKVKEGYWFFILGYVFFTFIISLYHFSVLGLIRSIFTFFSFYLCYLLIINKVNLFKIYFYFSLIPLFFSFLLQIKKDLFIWAFVDGRNASFMFDPNYCGVFFVSSALISLIIFDKNQLKWIYFSLFSIGVLFTFSKGAMLALFIGFFVYLYCNYYYKSLLYIFPFSVLILLFYFYSDFDFTLFRVEQGFNSRDGFFKAVLDHVFSNGNYMGGGDGILKKLLEDNYFENHSTHNFYLDLLVNNGLIPLIILIGFIGFICLLGFKDRNIYLSLFFALFIASNSISISLGGIGILSLILTLSAVMVLQRKDTLL